MFQICSFVIRCFKQFQVKKCFFLCAVKKKCKYIFHLFEARKQGYFEFFQYFAPSKEKNVLCRWKPYKHMQPQVLFGNYMTLILILFQLVEKCVALCNRPILILIQLVDKFVALCNIYKDHMMFPNKQYLHPTLYASPYTVQNTCIDKSIK